MKNFYPQQVIEHFERPRNVGTLPLDAGRVGCAKLGDVNVGDVLQLQIKLNQNNIVEDAKFRALGNPYLIAGASYLTDLLIGQSVEQIQKINYVNLIDALDIPQTKMYCAVMLEDVLKSAIDNVLE